MFEYRESWTIPYGNNAIGATLVIHGGVVRTQSQKVAFTATDPSGRQSVTSIIIPATVSPVLAVMPNL